MKRIAAAASALLLAACVETPPPATAEATAPAPREIERPEVSAKPAPEPVAPPEKGRLTTIGIEQVFALKMEGKALLIDVRRPLFYNLGHIEGALNLPLTDFEARYPELKPQLDAAAEAGRVIITYCQSETCPDSTTTAEALVVRGHDVSIYRGGLDEWRAAGVEP